MLRRASGYDLLDHLASGMTSETQSHLLAGVIDGALTGGSYSE